MTKNWYVRYNFPISFPTDEPIKWNDPRFEYVFIRTKIFDELDTYLSNICSQFGKFWVSSPSGGYGKSTALNYIARKLYFEIQKLKALPFLLHIGEKPYASVEHNFIQNFLQEFLNLDQNLKEASKILKINLPDEINHTVIKGFEKYKSEIKKFQADLPTLDVKRLEVKFYQVLEKVLSPWLESGIFNKYVLLVDEMDKLDSADVLTFLGGNQHLFEELYSKHGFVAFVSGHKSWVEKIHEGTEYSYYKGKIFSLPPFVNLSDVKQLVEARLVQYLYMVPADNPWTEEGYMKLLEVSGGVPRKILQLVIEIMNQAYLKKVERIGSGIVEDTLIGEKYVQIAKNYLVSHYQTFVKLKQAVNRKAHDLLYLFYEAPEQQIAKEFDENLAARTRYLGIELSDDEWRNQISTLTHLECLEDKGVVRKLSPDITAFFNLFKDSPAIIQKVIPKVIREVGEIKPIILEIPPPDYQSIIKKCFDISPNEWFSEEEIFKWFFDSVGIQTYIKQVKTKNPEKLIRKIFNREFKKYLLSASPNLMIFQEDGKNFYRQLPHAMGKDEYEQIKKLRSKQIVDKYIDLVVFPQTYDFKAMKHLDNFIEEILEKICHLKMVKFQEGILRRKERHDLFKRLELPAELRRHIDFYLRESRDTLPATGIIKETMREIIKRLAEVYDQLAVIPEEETSREDYTLLNTLEKTLRQHIEDELSKITDNWWKERVPFDVRENAEERKLADESPWPWYSKGKDNPLICYLDFSDYIRIITRRDNWRDTFKITFGDEAQIQASLKRLEPIRNAIAHNRPLTPDQKQVLSTEAKYICNSIRARIERPPVQYPIIWGTKSLVRQDILLYSLAQQQEIKPHRTILPHGSTQGAKIWYLLPGKYFISRQDITDSGEHRCYNALLTIDKDSNLKEEKIPYTPNFIKRFACDCLRHSN